ncbi:hypothetical protein BGX34_009649 [Mortierella sp. NVP85]|nr:hypothetical protein BGX34_009649 [Mortierella sp. NVP85]
MSAHPPATSSGQPHASPKLQHSHEPWSFESRKLKDKQIQVFCREYAKKIAAALTHHTSTTGGVSNTPPESHSGSTGTGKDRIVWPSPEGLVELYTRLLLEEESIDPKAKEILSDKSFVVSSFTANIAEKLEQQLSYAGYTRQPCGCIEHRSQSPLEFPEDSYEDEPEDEDYDDEDLDDEDEDDEDLDDEDLEDDDFDDNDEDDEDNWEDQHESNPLRNMPHHHGKDTTIVSESNNDKRQFAVMLKVRKALEEENRKTKLLLAQKEKLEKERIQLLQRLRREDEVRRTNEQEKKQKKEQEEKQKKEILEQELRKRREAAEADQTARSFLFKNTSNAQVKLVKRMVEMSPAESASVASIPTFSTVSATDLDGWEYFATVDGGGKVDKKQGMQETLLHVAVRVGCLDLAAYFISKGVQLDALDSDGRVPLHTAAQHSAPLSICKLLLEKAPYLVDRTSVTAGKTALHFAAQNGYGDLVGLLLQYHARINITDKEGKTPEMLAKAGMGREKSKSKLQKYRSALQHIKKALDAIKEAQKQKEAQLEEQRKREEELARAEAEKDRAARKKQEEKLEADQRRREEEEKELERLKALALDPHVHNSSGNKKKKKKKGKGQDAPTAKGLAAPAQNIATGSSSSSPVGSPAMAHHLQQPQPPTTSSVGQSVGTPKPQASTPVLAKVVSNAAPTPSPKPTLKPVSSKEITPPPESKVAQSSPLRLPKVKTSYRPSPLVVGRMADMGFPERNARKALIQTAGKFEEAIELLTSGAPLADDSEDEAEQQAARKKTKAKEVEPSPVPTAKQKPTPVSQMAPKATVSTISPQPTPTPLPTSKVLEPQQPSQSTPASGQLGQSGQKGASFNATPKGAINHPVQILQRPQNLPPHVQMRSIPTQVLQRPTAHSQASPVNVMPSPISKRKPSDPPAAIMPEAAPVNTSPFLAPLTVPPAPPTRAPYSYGSSSQNQTLRPPTPLGRAGSPKMELGSKAPLLASVNDIVSTPQPLPSFAGNNTVGQYHSSPVQMNIVPQGVPGFAITETTWDTQLGVHNMSPNMAQAAFPIRTPSIPSSIQDNLWGPSRNSTAISSFSSTQPLPAIGVPVGDHRPSFELLTSSVDEMLGTGPNESTIKDVLAMTGAIDLEELENTLLESSSGDSGGSTSRANARTCAAVGDGRVQAGTTVRNTVASLWGYGSFTQDISNMGQSWSASPSQRSRSMDTHTRDGTGSAYSQWRSKTEYEIGGSIHPPPGLGSSSSTATTPLVMNSIGTIGGHQSLVPNVDHHGGYSASPTDSPVLSAGIRALNNSLAYCRYPKLNDASAEASRASPLTPGNAPPSSDAPELQPDWRNKR